MPTPEELAQLEQEKKAADAAKEAAQKEEEARRAKELEGIPEALRGKSQKELADMLLQNSLETEKLRSDAEKARLLEAELQKFKSPHELSDEERAAAEEKEFYTAGPRYIKKREELLKQHIDEKLAPLRDTYFKDKEIEAEEWTKKELHDYAKYEKKIKEIMKPLNAEVRASKEAWRAVYRQVRYDDLEAELKEIKAKGGMHSELGGGNESEKEKGKKVIVNRRTGENFTDDEVSRAAAKFGMKVEDYISWSDNVDGQGGA